MKKNLICLLFLLLALALSLCACGGRQPAGEPAVPEQTDEAFMLQLLDTLYHRANGSAHAAMYLAAHEGDDAQMRQGAESADAFKTFTHTEIVPQLAVYSIPVMSPDPYFVYLFKAEEAADLDSIKAALKDNAPLGHQVCVSAETVRVASNGSYLLYVMGSEAETEILVNAFLTLVIS